MLFMMIEKGMPIDEIVHADTGMEYPEMEEEFERIRIRLLQKGYTITTVKSNHSFEHWMLHHVKTKGKRKGQKGYSFPDFINRWCTACMKQDPINRYLRRKYKDRPVKQYIGIAYDEKKRARDKEYPLIKWKVTEKDALEYCYKQGFTWDGLYEKLHRVSCWCCPLQRLGELKVLFKEYPELWEKLKEWEDQTYRTFRSDYTVRELEEKFLKEDF